MAGCQSLTILGGIFEVVGFGMIVWQLARVQRQEFGWPRFLSRWYGRLRAHLRRLLRRPPIVASASASMSLALSTSARGSVRRGMGPEAPDRFAAIEYNLTEIEKELRERIGE